MNDAPCHIEFFGYNEDRLMRKEASMTLDSAYDVLIVGAGPAGIFAALELSQTPGVRVLILDKGQPIEKRRCPMREQGGPCRHCQPCNILNGWGGAGAFSDGKLTLGTAVGGHLAEIVGEEAAQALVNDADALYCAFGAPTKVYGQPTPEIEALEERAIMAGLRLIVTPIRHMGTERSAEIMHAMAETLRERGVTLAMRTAVESILTEEGRVIGVRLKNGNEVRAPYVILGPGREGAAWLVQTAQRLGLRMARNPVDLGVRVELPAAVLKPITDLVYESKFVYTSRQFDDPIRTFCMCPYGEVSTEYAGDVMTVNGHSYADHKTNNTNFALLVSKTFTEPFDDPIAYGKSIARLANLLSGGIIVQRLGDLRSGRRSTPERIARSLVRPTLPSAVPGDLNLVLPYRYVGNLLEMFDALDKVAPGVAAPSTLLYGVEVKFYSNRLYLTQELETEITGLFACGDGAGVTRGLIQASASGLLAARAIRKRIEGTG